jgi:hypothetical protein
MTTKRLSKELKRIFNETKEGEDVFVNLARYVNRLLEKTNNSAYSRGKLNGLSQ